MECLQVRAFHFLICLRWVLVRGKCSSNYTKTLVKGFYVYEQTLQQPNVSNSMWQPAGLMLLGCQAVVVGHA